MSPAQQTMHAVTLALAKMVARKAREKAAKG
jgi:hypothetical protein